MIDAMQRGSGPTGQGSPLLVGSRYCVREDFDGQRLAPPERLPVESRRYPEHPEWKKVAEMINHGTSSEPRDGTNQRLTVPGRSLIH